MFQIASWNVNSIRVRKDRVIRWLKDHRPDVLCVQETKVTDDLFPFGEFEELGYQVCVHGQKTYNGVALISRLPAESVVRGFQDGGDDSQARFVAGTFGGIRVCSAYVPNGSSLTSDKYPFKLDWLRRLRRFLDENEDPNMPFVLCGDWNVAPADLDVHDAQLWEAQVLCTDAERRQLERVVDWGLVDTFRLHHPTAQEFSWWDYRMLGFPKNKGLRIDHVYASDPLASKCVAASIDRDERKGKGASDHAPVIASFDW